MAHSALCHGRAINQLHRSAPRAQLGTLGALANHIEDQPYHEAMTDLVDSFSQLGLDRPHQWFGVAVGSTAAERGAQSFYDTVSDSDLGRAACSSSASLHFLQCQSDLINCLRSVRSSRWAWPWCAKKEQILTHAQ